MYCAPDADKIRPAGYYSLAGLTKYYFIIWPEAVGPEYPTS